MGTKFYLDFLSDAIGELEIDEPIGVAEISWDLQQKENGYARDITFNGGESELTFVNLRLHYLEHILYYFNYFGFESKINLIIEINGVQSILGELDFAMASTDELTYFKCKVVQDSSLQIIKRRNDIKVDLISDKNLDGEVIAPLVPENILIKAKTTFEESVWKNADDANVVMSTANTRTYAINPCLNIEKSEIADTLTFFSTITNNLGDFQVIEAKENLKNIKVTLKDVGIYIDPIDGNGQVVFQLRLVYGNDYLVDGVNNIFMSATLTESSATYNSEGNEFILNIDNLERGQKIWIAAAYRLDKSGVGATNFKVTTNVHIGETIISAQSTSYNTICPSFRLIDVMKQVIKSISGLEIVAPRFDVGGEFYDNRILNGNFLRGITDKPFNISLKDIYDSIIEMNADFEVNSSVFFGIREDYYKNVEIWFFDNVQFSETEKGFNEIMEINEFKLGYKKYQSLKENEDINSADVIHGTTSWLVPNKLVENKKEVLIEWVRDAFLIEELRRKSYEITETTSSQNDTDIFVLDSVNTLEDASFTEYTVLNHEHYVANGRLILTNAGSINFLLLGITVGSNFVIHAPDNNAGNYTVFSVAQSSMELTKVGSPPVNSNNNGIRSTKYTYYISMSLIPFKNYTNENFTEITNLFSSESYSNLRYSVKRNILNYWGDYLATCNFYNKEKSITNTVYNNNGLCNTTYNGSTVLENKSFTTSKNPILSAYSYKNMIFKNVEFEDYITIQSLVRSERGYIRTIDNNGNPIKVYPKKMSYENLNKQLTLMVADEKYDPTTLSINETNGIIMINNEIGINVLNYTIEDNYVSVYDENNELLYKPVWWFNVSVNGAVPDTINILINWLNLLL